MDSIGCNANQQFGLPLNPFPMGSPWTSVREMLYDVMVDFHRGWVQDFFIRSDPLADTRVLLSQQHLDKSAAFTMCLDLDENFRRDFGRDFGTRNVFMVGLMVPIDTIDDIFTGLIVQSFAGVNPLGDRTDFVTRGIINTRQKTLAKIVWNDESRNVDVNYGHFEIGNLVPQAALKFDKQGFLRAFESMPGRIDFDMLEKSLLSSAVSEIKQANKTSCTVPQNALTTSRGEKFPHRDMFAVGDWMGSCVMSNYKNSVLMKTQSGFTLMSREYGAAHAAVEKMKSWALRDRTSLLIPIPEAPISIHFGSQNSGDTGTEETVDTFSDAVHDKFTAVEIFKQQPPKISKEYFLEDDRTNQPSRAVRIAPALMPTVGWNKPAQTAAGQLTMSKIEIRKIRRREAAAKSNAKRSAERKRIRELQQEKGLP